MKASVQDEQKMMREMKAVFARARKDTQEKIQQLSSRIPLEPENLQTIIYQIQYQQAIQQQLDNALHDLQKNTYDTVDQYMKDSYNRGYVGTMYSLKSQGIPITVPIDQNKVVKALQINSKISNGLYNRMGENVARLKNSIRAEVSRGIANGSSWNQIAHHIANGMNSPFRAALNRTLTIARTEGHRVQEDGAMDGAQVAREKGADQVKQWDSALDERVRPAHREADGQIRELDEPFTVMGEEVMKPGDGSAGNCINCRCHVLFRARWALDEAELQTLKDRAKVHGLYGVENQNFEDFKNRYLKLPDNADTVPVDNAVNEPLKSSNDKSYNALLSALGDPARNSVDYLPVQNHTQKVSPDDIINLLAGGDRTRGSCASVGLAYIGQMLGWDVRDFRGGDSQQFFSHGLNLHTLSQADGMVALRAKGACSLTVGNGLLKQCEQGKEYYLCVGRHAAIVRKNDEGKLQYLELQSADKSGWTDFNGNPRYTLSNRFGCSSQTNHSSQELDFMLDLQASDFSSDEFRSLLGYLNTEPSKEMKGQGGTIK